MKELWIANADLVAEALLDPFVVALGQGILPKSVFQSYIAQDAYFLSSFARGYDTAGERCRSDRTLTPSVAANVIATLEDLKAGVLEELKLHDQCGQSSSQAGNTFQPTAATSRYTEWLEVVINDSDSSAATILAAMVPCLRLYAYLGCTLRKAFPEANQPYAEWIETYSHLSYLQLPAMAEGLFDVLVPSNIGGGLGGGHGECILFLALFMHYIDREERGGCVVSVLQKFTLSQYLFVHHQPCLAYTSSSWRRRFGIP